MSKRKQSKFELTHPNAAGIDIGTDSRFSELKIVS